MLFHPVLKLSDGAERLPGEQSVQVDRCVASRIAGSHHLVNCVSIHIVPVH